MPEFQVASARDAFADFWHKNAPRWTKHPFTGFASEDERQALVIAKNQIQDTSDALLVHRRRGFCTDPYQGYIELWGILQAVVLQQDAIFELHYALTGHRPSTSPGAAWAEIRAFRDLLAGHSSRNFRGKAKRRCTIPRQKMSYSGIEYKVYEDGNPTHRTLRLGQLLDRYDSEAAQALAPIFAGLENVILSLPAYDTKL